MQAAGGARERGAGSREQGSYSTGSRSAYYTMGHAPNTHTRCDLEGKHVEGPQSRTNKPTLERIGGKRERERERREQGTSATAAIAVNCVQQGRKLQ